MVIPFCSLPVEYFKPLQVQTTTDYTLNVQKFPGLDDIRHRSEPALMVASTGHKTDHRHRTRQHTEVNTRCHHRSNTLINRTSIQPRPSATEMEFRLNDGKAVSCQQPSSSFAQDELFSLLDSCSADELAMSDSYPNLLDVIPELSVNTRAEYVPDKTTCHPVSRAVSNNQLDRFDRAVHFSDGGHFNTLNEARQFRMATNGPLMSSGFLPSSCANYGFPGYGTLEQISTNCHRGAITSQLPSCQYQTVNPAGNLSERKRKLQEMISIPDTNDFSSESSIQSSKQYNPRKHLCLQREAMFHYNGLIPCL